MMKLKNNLFFALFVLASLSVKSQSAESITGKWQFKELYKVTDMDSIGKQMLEKMFGEMTVYLKPNHHYKNLLMVQEEGTWDYDSTKRKITFTANKGTKSTIKIDLLSATQMVINFDKEQAILMEKVVPGAKDEIEEATQKLQLVQISESQLCKKWFLQSRYVPNRTAEQTKLVSDLFKGTYLFFHPNKTYDVKLASIMETGTWSLENNDTKIILTSGGETKFWNVKTVMQNELTLFRGNTEETWTFSTTE